jgi:hydrogenase/urease accessory protein HupE
MLAAGAEAHPVAQGSLIVTLSPGQLTVRATISLEEVLVASAYGKESAQTRSAEEAAARYGAYLLEHLRIHADGRRLEGRQISSLVAKIDKPPLRFVYDLAYPLEKPASEFRFEQDVLNEFEFAPGNRWEASYVVQVIEEGRAPREGLLLTSRQPLLILREQPATVSETSPRLDRWQVVRDYFHHGLLHILTGYDHLLFVTVLVLAVRTLWELVKVVTAFTLAHSITLALSAFDLFRLSSAVVEPAIAASIVFVALQNVFWPERTRGWTRLGVAFFFGLFHGLGFAGGLLEAMEGMSSQVLLLAILGFSAGVEVGHQIVVLPTFCGLKLAHKLRGRDPEAGARPLLISRWISAVISVAGMIYLGAALRGR